MIPTKVHAQLANKDTTFMTVVERLQDIQSSQEISTACFALQRALGYYGSYDIVGYIS
jgi:hypothetical protein